MTSPRYLLAVGTKKGLWLATSEDRRTWSVGDPHFLMQEVPSIGIDTRGGRTRLLVGVRSEHFGPTVVHSDDLGATWTEPERGSVVFPEGTDAAVERIWQIRPDAESRPGVVWVGAEPISVWRSSDGGETFDLNRALWDHPDKEKWGAGAGGAAVHTIVPDPMDDGGRLYAQNHRGVYRSDDGGDTWMSIADGLPADFGFVMLTHPRRGGTAWVVPLVSDWQRTAPEGRLAVHRTDDAGATWRRLEAGLAEPDWNTVLRDAASVDTAEPVGVYFGTRGGSVYASADEGETFHEVFARLPDVLCVRAAVLDPGAADAAAHDAASGA